ncbi:MAG: hypothetical protein AB1599_11140 [Planctomycetota bacterium]
MTNLRHWSWLVILCALCVFAALTGYSGCFKRETPLIESGSSAPVPGVFNLSLPIEGVNVNPLVFYPVPSFAVSWTDSANATNYLLEISKDDDFTAANSVYSPTFSSGAIIVTVPEGAVLPNKWYYWRVTASNSGGSTIASNCPLAFCTGMQTSSTPPAGVFDLSAPLDSPPGQTSALSPDAESLIPNLSWTNAQNEVYYIIYLDDDSSFMWW